MAGIDLAPRAGIGWTYITGRGGMQTVMDVVTGQADVFFNGMLPTVPHIQSARLRLLAVSSDKRVERFPNAPTIAESGMPGFLTGSWQGVLAPAGTPREVLARLQAEVTRIVRLPELRKRYIERGIELVASASPDEFTAGIRVEFDKKAKLARDTGMRLE